jgi:1-acyl-sn-glycerol-3-phosphate acyltransferase
MGSVPTVDRSFAIRRTVARLILRLIGWKTYGEVPQRGVLVGAPHTSNWDWVMTILLTWSSERQIRLMVKDELFKGPLGIILRATGAVPVDRRNPAAAVRKLVRDAASDEGFLLGIAAEGTRSKQEYWKSGFYRIAQETGLPVTLAGLDAPTRSVGWGPTIHLSGNVKADMDRIREFYADKHGFDAAKVTPARLRNEPEGPARPQA